MIVIHVIWDWNGTLVDDLPIVVESVNAALAAIGESPIDENDYRQYFTRPVDQFYVRLLKRSISDEEWSTLDGVFHEHYGTALDRVPFTSDALAAIDDVEARGWTQSILSMWWEEDLTACVRRRGLAERMSLVQGNRNDAGGEKAAHLMRHLTILDIDPASVVMIGDSLDDATAAGVVGTACVLYDGGSHHRDHLENAGLPVADTLIAAVSIAAQLER